MIKKYDIIAAARTISRKSKGYRAPMLIHPQRDWWIGLCMFAVIVIAGGGVLARMYALNDSLDSLVGAEANSIPRYREEVVQDVLTEYRTRGVAYQMLIENTPNVETVATSTTATSTDEAVDGEVETLEISDEATQLQ